MLFLMMFIRKVKGEPRQRYAYIYQNRPYPMGIRSLARHKQRVAQAKEHK